MYASTALHDRLLCVDPNSSYLRLYLRELEPRGYLVDVVANGMGALGLLSEQSYDLVCLALDLPDITGAEVLHRMQSELGLEALPVVVTSPHASGDALQVIDLYRMTVLLGKPFSGARLAKLIERHLRPQASH